MDRAGCCDGKNGKEKKQSGPAGCCWALRREGKEMKKEGKSGLAKDWAQEGFENPKGFSIFGTLLQI
jgi:hypothetical protein